MAGITIDRTRAIPWLRLGGVLCISVLLSAGSCSPRDDDGDGEADPPQISSHPEDVAVLEGDTATFRVSAQGSQGGPLSYQWQRNGVDLPGANSSTLVLPNRPLDDNNALYRVVVTENAGTGLALATSSLGARLTVNPRPVQITQQPVDRTVPEGGSATFVVFAEGSQPLTYQWQHDGVSIPGATSSSLTIAAAALADAGAYRCIVRNVAGPVTSLAALLTVVPAQPPPVSARALAGEVGTAVNNVLLFADLGIPGSSRRLVLADSAGRLPLTTLEQAGTWGSFPDLSAGTFLRFDNNAGRRENLQVGAHMYYRNNQLAIVDNLSEAGGSARRWTNAETFDICGGPGGAQQRTAQDYADPRRSYMFFTVPGTDDNCFMFGNVEWAAARVDADENTPLMRIGGEPLAVRYRASGEIDGYIQREGTGVLPQAGDQVRYVDRDFRNPINLFRFANAFTLGTVGDAAPGRWIFTDRDRLMSYALDGSEAMPRELIAPAAGSTIEGNFWLPGFANVLFFAFLLTGDEQLVAPVLSDLSVRQAGKFMRGPANPFNDYHQTDSHIIAYGTLPKRFQSLPKEGGTAATMAMTIETLPADVNIVPMRPFAPRFAVGSGVRSVQFLLTAGERFWWQTSRNATGTPSRVCSMRGDGTDRRCIDGARIAKWVAQPQLGFGERVQAHTIYVAENEDPVSGFSGSPVRAYDGVTASVRFDLGTLPTGASVEIVDASSAPLQFGMPGLITIGFPGGEHRVLRFKSDEPGLMLMSD